MEMRMIRIGDRVRCMQSQDGKQSIIGKDGNVIDCSYDIVCVEFDEFIEGHNGGEICSDKFKFGKEGHCWNIISSELILLEKKKNSEEILKSWK